jgi:hypothetical protein
MSTFRTLAKAKRIGFLLAVGVSLCACKKRSAPVEAMSKVPIKEAASAIGIQPSDLPDHQALYDAITKYMTANQGRAAKDVDELVQKGFLKPLPPLPSGKRYHLDQRAAVLSILDK